MKIKSDTVNITPSCQKGENKFDLFREAKPICSSDLILLPPENNGAHKIVQKEADLLGFGYFFALLKVEMVLLNFKAHSLQANIYS